ncbi:MAG: DUF493 domain-containing protein [Pseudomonadaceae bacterium]|nr:DUF493 domain-containing protein [Pseudomonadaceae bacterium]
MTEPPKIEFPCDYPIKVVSDNSPDLVSELMLVVQQFAPETTAEHVSLRDSKKGTYTSVTFMIEATGEPQLKALFEALMKHDAVRLVL